MNKFLKIVSFSGLALTVLPSIMVFNGQIGLEMHKTIALIGSVLWIATAPFWINKTRGNVQD